MVIVGVLGAGRGAGGVSPREGVPPLCRATRVKMARCLMNCGIEVKVRISYANGGV